MKVLANLIMIPIGALLIWLGMDRLVGIIKEWREEKVHGTPPGTYPIDMD